MGHQIEKISRRATLFRSAPPISDISPAWLIGPFGARLSDVKKLALAIAIAMALTSPVAAQPSIAILTGSTSGVYYPLGNAISAIFLKTIPGARSSVQVTQGSIENLKLLEDGDGELAFSLGDSLSAAWKGNAEAGFRTPLTKLRGIAAIYRNYVQLVVSEASGIKALADLKGKRVSVGPKQSGTELNARAIFAAAGLSYRDFSRTDYLPFGQSAKLIEKGDLDATLQSAGLGVDSIRQLGTSVAIRLLEIPKDLVIKINDIAATTGYGDPAQKYFKFGDGEQIVAAMTLDPRAMVPPTLLADLRRAD